MRTARASTFGMPAGVPTSLPPLYGVACAAETRCIAVGGDRATHGVVLATRDGSHWTATTVPGLAGLSGVACTSPNACLAVGATSSGHAGAG